MLDRLFKPRWQHPDPDTRLRAIQGFRLDDPTQLGHLATLARGDSSEAVRAAAVARLNDLKLLDQITRHDASATVRDAAVHQVERLLAGVAEGAPGRENRLRLIGLTSNARALAFVARNAPEQACRLAAVARLDDQALLRELALEGPDEPLRVAAAERVRDPDALRTLIREARDKRVQRIARERQKALQQQEDAQLARQQRVTVLLREITQHAGRALDNLYGPRLDQLGRDWETVREHADEAQREQAAEALGQARARLEARAAEAALAAATEQARHELDATLDTLQQLRKDLDARHWDDLSSLRALVATQERRWEAALELTPASERQQARFASLREDWQALLNLAAELTASEGDEAQELLARWPADVPLPERWQQHGTDADSEVDAGPAQAEGGTGRDLAKLLGALQGALRRRNLRQANRLWRRALEEMEVEGDALPPKLARLRPQLDELRDWHGFVAGPRKEALCERMERLASVEMDPEEKATAIQALHEEWRELMSSDQEADQALWDRFRAASDLAYVPCREHFRELDAQRAANLAKRRDLCRQLEEFIAAHDWPNADWASVHAIRRQAPQEWKSYQPVAFTEARELGKRFSQLLTTLDERLQQASDAHVAELEKLLDEAERLAASDDANAADAFKALQKKWNAVGWTLPGPGRSLHRRFRKAGDRLFARRKAAHEARVAESRERNEALAVALDSLQAELDRPLDELDSRLLEERLAAARALCGQGSDRGLGERFHDQERRVRRLREELPRRREWQALRDRLAALPEAPADDAQRRLAVAVEFAAGIDSPADAREERRQWQLEQLQAAMTGARNTGMDAVREVLGQHEEVLQAGVDPDIRRRLLAAVERGFDL